MPEAECCRLELVPRRHLNPGVVAVVRREVLAEPGTKNAREVVVEDYSLVHRSKDESRFVKDSIAVPVRVDAL